MGAILKVRRVFLLVSAAALAVAIFAMKMMGLPRVGGFAPAAFVGTPDEEFIGPFASWWNVKTDCGAVGDGSANDTAAVQTCLNNVGTSSKSALWFPAGTYKVSDVSTTATGSSGASAITVASGTGIVAGMAVYATGVPAGDTVTSAYVPGSTTVPLRHPTTAALSSTPTVFGLDIQGKINIALWGDSPATTSLVWAGSSGGTMLLIDGVAHSTFNRLTFNGSGTAKILVDQSYYSTSDVYFDEHMQYADDVFENTLNSAVSYGLRCGYNTNGCSEIDIIRDTFQNIAGNALAPCDSNTLDVWVWYSTFKNNGYGIISNVPGDSSGCYQGGFHAVGNYFSGSTAADILPNGQTQYYFLNNYSTGSNRFIYATNTGIQAVRNTIVNTTQNDAIVSASTTLLIDNKIQTKSGNTAPAVSSPASGRLFTVGNTFTVASPYSGFSSTLTYELDDATGTIDPTPPTLPSTPPHATRTIYEASTTGTNNSTCSVASPCTVQAAICVAATGTNAFASGNCTGTVNANKSVVHLQPGTYAISATVSVPANSNIQILGDSSSSNLAGGSGVNPVLQVNGPSQVVLGYFQVTATSTTDGIKMVGIDQPGAMVYSDNSLIESSYTSFLFSDNLNNALVQPNNFTYFYGPNEPAESATGIVKTGNNTLNVFLFACLQILQDISVAGNGAFLQVGGRNDGGSNAPTIAASVTGGGSVVEGANQRALGTSQASYNISNYTGKFFTFDTWYVICSSTGAAGGVNITGTGTGAQELIALNWFPFTGNLNNTATGNQLDFIGNSGDDSSCNPSVAIPDVTSGISGTMNPAFIRSVLAPLRAASPLLPSSRPAGVTNIEMYRLDVFTAANNIHLTP